MCGIVGAVSTRNIVPILVEGLKRLEYRGYDSCGVAVHQGGGLRRARSTARVAELEAQVAAEHIEAGTGIAHTRWATHGAPAVHNAHPHFSAGPNAAADALGTIALVHNGIIENHEELRAELKAKGYVFVSQTDTEVIAHLVDQLYDGDLFEAVQQAVARLRGAYAIAVFCRDEPQRVVGARAGSPLVLGVGKGENFLASDAMALAGVTDQIVYLEEGDVVDLQLGKHWIVGHAGGRRQHCARCSARSAPCRRTAARPSSAPTATTCKRRSSSSRGHRRHARRRASASAPELFGDGAYSAFKDIDQVLILACGTSYYARLGGQVLARERSPASRPASRSPASTATATACPTRAPWSSPSARAAKPPTRWRR